MMDYTSGGTAHLYLELSDRDDPSSRWVWTGYIDNEDGTPDREPGLAAQVPPFDTDQEAIAWALERTGRVVIYDPDKNNPFWAGSDPAPDDVPVLRSERP
ncbi:hypothetical protein [Nonomuraea sp. NPDC050310]|uniref:hypothetical protein n=1 Tax=unclassified Nonomuraea TaxID=2593643 RepID=UPI0033EFDF9A